MNRLKDETSPYLLQHADNPVAWHPWGDDAFRIAREKDRPLLLSIGYSACHWCHVMAHESFEDEATAALMNALFVNVKVDREERPDVDDIYMQAVQALVERGGWPLTVFLLPDGRPFYGGTYYPPAPRYGMPSFKQVLQAVADAYQQRRDVLEEQAGRLHQALKRDVLAIGRADESGLNTALLDGAAAKILANFDRVHGGFGGAPKFPSPIALEYLLRAYARTENADALHAVEHTLRRMARGGIYDQIGGGFARYSVDAQWLVPHFEKMLYDNAQLSRVYLHAWQLTGDAFFKTVAEDIYDYILREMTAADGGFYSATDADSEGEEGRFFVWTLAELRAALEPLHEQLPRASEIAIAYFGVTAGGNFEGANILHRPRESAQVAEELGISPAALQAAAALIRQQLYDCRRQRVHPQLDDKILTAWNGMMLASLAEAARVFKRDDYLLAAQRGGEFLLRAMYAGGRLQRTHKDGISKLNGYLEDYAHLIDALLELYQSTFDEKWFAPARALADVVLARFRAGDGGFYDTSDDHEQLIVRPRSLQDGVAPSGNAMMAKQLLRLSAYTGAPHYDEAAVSVLRLLTDAMQQYPQAFVECLNATEMRVMGLCQVALVGAPHSESTQALLDVLREGYRPNLVVALAAADVDEHPRIPLLNQRQMLAGQPTVYVCRDFTCRLPLTDADALAAELAQDAAGG